MGALLSPLDPLGNRDFLFALEKWNNAFGFADTRPWYYPPGTTFVKHFDLELTKGVAASRRRIETRVIVLSPSGVAQGFTYRWDDAQTNAILVPSSGLDETFSIRDGEQVRRQVWRYPARQECVSCHNVAAGAVQSFVTAQLNRDIVIGGRPVNQLVALAEAGYLAGLPPAVHRLPALAAAADTAWSLGWRARSFLAVNCAPCHRDHGLANRSWKADLGTPLAQADLVGFYPYDHRGDWSTLLVNPGSPEQSVLFQRLASLALGHMPPLATSVLDGSGIALVRDWIEQETPKLTAYPDWLAHLDEDASPDQPPYRREDDPDGDGADNEFEWLSRTSPGVADPDLGLRVQLEDGQVRLQFHRLAARDYDVQWTTDPEVGNSWESLDHPVNLHGPFAVHSAHQLRP